MPALNDPLNDDALELYARHLLLDALGIAGQRRLAAASVVVIGVGGLGCPAATYLAGCGIGKLILVDDDSIELSNLQRQTLFRHTDIGKAKVEVAATALRALNPHIDIQVRKLRADATNLPKLLDSVSVVVDGCDNFTTRHAVNAACQGARVSLVCGAAEQFDGQAFVFDFAKQVAPCYNCVFPAGKEIPATTPCAELGVFAPLTGLIGSVMAAETVRLLALDDSAGLRSRMLAYDMLAQRVREVAIKPVTGCNVCAT